MTTVYNLCKLLIQKNRTDGLQEKMDVYLAADLAHPGGVPGAGRAACPRTVINSGIAG